MAYTAPRTWVAGELVTASIMNVHVRDNLIALKDPPTALYDVNEAADYTTTSTSFVDVDATDLALTITTTGGDVFICFTGSVGNSAGANDVFLDVDLDGARLGGDDGRIRVDCPSADTAAAYNASFCIWKRSLSAASHTFKLQWRVNAGTGKMWAGAGTGNFDLHPQFSVREAS